MGSALAVEILPIERFDEIRVLPVVGLVQVGVPDVQGEHVARVRLAAKKAQGIEILVTTLYLLNWVIQQGCYMH